MGEARKRRLTLIRGGKADIAKTMYVAPERLTNITVQMPSLQAKVLQAVYDTKVDKKTCPTLTSFLMALLESGMNSFEAYWLEQNDPKPSDIELDPVTKRPVNTPLEPPPRGSLTL